MTFANWLERKRGAFSNNFTESDFALMRDAYETGVNDERHACATVCESIHDWTDVGRLGVMKDCADAIRGRSNANPDGMPHRGTERKQ